MGRRHELRVGALTAALLVGLLAWGCGDDSGQGSTGADATPVASSDPEQFLDSSESDLDAEADRRSAAAADVIRTRIAWKESSQGAGFRPTATPRPPLEVVLNGATVTAPQIALMWTVDAAGAFEYGDAVSYCEGLETAGFDDWRLPTIDELERLLDTEYQLAATGAATVLWTSSANEYRGVETVELPERTRSHRQVGLGHVICVRHHW